jgi:ATP-dependent helicase/DNAse subunit B
MLKKAKYLSASRIKTFKSCSWLYWCKYGLGLPDTTNSGALRGTICHLIFELLLESRHKKHQEIISEKKTIKASPPIDRLVKKHLKQSGIFDAENYDLMDEMIVVGLRSDFYVEGSELLDPEFEFDITNESPSYRIYGFIDKIAKFKNKNEILISDYKSSKGKFKGEDLESNVQAMIYSLVAKKTWPKLKPVVEFLFLRFPKKPIQRLEFSDDALEGFEYYLEEVYKSIRNFDEKDAESNFAADKPIPKEGFSGKLMCGFAKEKGQLKKDGSLMWHCPYKFDFSYHALKDKNGNVLKTDFENTFSPKKGETVEKMNYDGCPRHNGDMLDFF